MLEAKGIYRRTMTLLVNIDSIDFSTGRKDIHSALWNAINQHPIIGLGISGDMAAIGELSHGLFISIITIYGYFMGITIIGFLMISCIKGLTNSETLTKEILIMYMCLVFPRAFTGGDIWDSDVFWWLVGILLMGFKQHNILKLDGAYDKGITYN